MYVLNFLVIATFANVEFNRIFIVIYSIIQHYSRKPFRMWDRADDGCTILAPYCVHDYYLKY